MIIMRFSDWLKTHRKTIVIATPAWLSFWAIVLFNPLSNRPIVPEATITPSNQVVELTQPDSSDTSAERAAFYDYMKRFGPY